jgi:hypothetical protein
MWSWGNESRRPELRAVPAAAGDAARLVMTSSAHVGSYRLACADAPSLLFTENETNTQRLWGVPNRTPFVKDGIHETIVHGSTGTTNPAGTGTKMAAHYSCYIAPGATETITLRLSAHRSSEPFAEFDAVFAQRRAEADAFSLRFGAEHLSNDARQVQRQVFAGLLWSKQFYRFDVNRWLDGDPAGPPPPSGHRSGRNADWRHLNTADVISMPDTWEYPWYAAWDLAFRCIPLAQVDPEFAK